MVGLTLAVAKKRRSGELLRLAMGNAANSKIYCGEEVVISDSVAVGWRGYEGYPIWLRSDSEVFVGVEGCVYERSGQGLSRLARVLGELLCGCGVEAVQGALGDLDGEFVAVGIDKRRGGLVVVTDRFGRLPLYAWGDGCEQVISRDVWACVKGGGVRTLDPLGLSQFLMLGYCIGERTLFEGVRRVKPGAIIRGCSTKAWQWWKARVERGEEKEWKQHEMAGQLAAALVDATRRRCEFDGTPVVSLSGGVDSRLVAGALVRAGARPRSVTHTDLSGAWTEDCAVAEKVASELGLPWELMRLEGARGRDVRELLQLKGGMNYLGMSGVVPFCRELRRRFGTKSRLFTGDHGMLLKDNRPLVKLRSAYETAKYIVEVESVFNPSLVASVTRVEPGRVAASIAEVVDGYEERLYEDRFRHFVMLERGRRFVAEGEDRNRAFVWSTSPFMGTGFAEVALAMDAVGLRGHRVRGDVLRLVAPGLERVPDVATRGRVGGVWLRVTSGVRRLRGRILLRGLSQSSRRELKRWVHGGGRWEKSAVVDYMKRVLEKSVLAPEYLNRAGWERLLRAAEGCDEERFGILLTVVAVVDELETCGEALSGFESERLL